MSNINRSGEPLYMTITNDLKSAICSGEMNPGDMLQSENELAARYGTSRTTVRKSMQLLEHEGLIYSWQGKGYFVAQPVHDTFSIHFSEEERGFDVSYRKVNVIMPDEEIQSALQIGPRQMVIEILRIIRRRDVPVALDVKYIPYDKGTPVLEKELSYAVFPEIAAAKTAPFAFHTEMKISAGLPTERVAGVLGCPMDAPLLTVYHILVDQNDRRVGYGIKYMLPDYGPLCARSGYEF